MRTRAGLSTTTAAIAVIVVVVIVGAGVYGALSLGGNRTSTITSTAVSTATATSTSTAVSTATATATSTVTTASTVISTTASTVTVSSTASPVVAPTMVYQRNSAVNDADPRDTSSIDLTQQSFETLTYLTPDGTVIPGLATAWRSINGSTWEYTLRQGVTFHDGTTFNATDVLFSIANTIKWGGGDAPIVWDTYKSGVAVSPYVVDLTFTQPVNAPIITSAAYAAFIFSHNVVRFGNLANDTSALHAWFNQFHDDGSGPYVLNSTASSLSGGVWVLNQYKSYWHGWKPGQVTTVIEKLVTNVNTAIQLAQQGQFDFIGIGGQYQFVPSLLSAGLNVVVGPTHGSIWLLFNTQHQYLNNSLVRQALLTAINYQQVLQQSYYNYGITFNGMINPGLAFYSPNAPGYPAGGNLTTAKALLAKAGYPNGLPNVQFTLTHSTGSPFEATIGQLLNTYWQPLGASVSIQGLTFTNQAIKAGYINGSNAFVPGPISYASTNKAQDLALLNWNGATSDPWLVPDELFAIQPAPYQNSVIYNWSYLRNATFTNLLNQFRADEVVNPTQATAEAAQLNQMFYQLSPGWAMFQGQQIWVVSPHWKNIIMNPNYSFDFFFFYDWTYSP